LIVALFRGRERSGGPRPAGPGAADSGADRIGAQPGLEPQAETPRPSARGDRRRSGADNQEGDDVANIGKSISIKGDLTGNEDLVVEGKVEGKIDLPSNQLTIGANGSARAEVTAKSVVIVGRVSGNVSATERIEIQATGIVEGDVSAPRLIVAEGAVVNGSVSMGKAGEAAKPVPQEPRPAAATVAASG